MLPSDGQVAVTADPYALYLMLVWLQYDSVIVLFFTMGCTLCPTEEKKDKDDSPNLSLRRIPSQRRFKLKTDSLIRECCSTTSALPLNILTTTQEALLRSLFNVSSLWAT